MTHCEIDTREENFRRNLAERTEQKEILDTLPFLLRFDFSNRCNLRCVFCRDDAKTSSFLPRATIEQLEGLYSRVKKIWLFGWGEPLLHPNYQEIVDYLVAFGAEICFITNGQLITDTTAERMVKSGVGQVRISIDASTRETYEKLRRGGSFDKLMAAIRSINKFKKKHAREKPSIGFNFVAMRENIAELPCLVKLADELKVEDIGVSFLCAGKTYEGIFSSLYFDQDLSDEMMRKARSDAEKAGIRLVLPPLFSEAKTDTGKPQNCTEPWSTAFIRHDGMVCACCAAMIEMGSLTDDTFENIWNGDAYRDLRRRVNSENPPLACKCCADNQQKGNPIDPLAHISKDFWERYLLEHGIP